MLTVCRGGQNCIALEQVMSHFFRRPLALPIHLQPAGMISGRDCAGFGVLREHSGSSDGDQALSVLSLTALNHTTGMTRR